MEAPSMASVKLDHFRKLLAQLEDEYALLIRYLIPDSQPAFVQVNDDVGDYGLAPQAANPYSITTLLESDDEPQSALASGCQSSLRSKSDYFQGHFEKQSRENSVSSQLESIPGRDVGDRLRSEDPLLFELDLAVADGELLTSDDPRHSTYTSRSLRFTELRRSRGAESAFTTSFASPSWRDRQESLQKKLREKMFPVWWNPNKVNLDKMMMRHAILEHEKGPVEPQPACVLSPVTFPKLHWDLFGFLLIFYDAWASPFQMLFESDDLPLNWMSTINIIITLFFAIDIVLNFNTGLVVKRGICFDRKQIVKGYLKKWFWLDLVATLPYDLLYSGGSVAGFLRFLKILKALKTLRFIRVMRTLKSLQSTENDYFNMIAKSKNLIRCITVLISLVVNVHLCSCLWLATQSDFEDPKTLSQARNIYLDTFVSVFLAVLNGAPLHAQSPASKLIEMLIASEQLLLIAVFSALAIFEALLLHGDAAKAQLMRDRALRYMRRHQLPLKTQIEVLSGLNEAGSVRALQKDFASLSSNDLHEELRRKIAHELWTNHFMSLSLIAKISEWDPDFNRSLSLICNEDILATDALIFYEYDLSIAAYHILSGELKVTCPLVESDIPSFTSGSWVGESALVNPSFRRGLRATTLSLSCLMVVPAVPFQKLLKESNLWDNFQYCVRSEVWQGLCGRCGSLGDHFFDSCPFIYVQWRSGKFSTPASASKAKKQRRTTAARFSLFSMSAESLPPEDQDQASVRELINYLRRYESLHLLPYLNEVEIYSLDDLQALDMSQLSAHLSKKNPSIDLTLNDKRVISMDCIKAYRESMLQGMDEVMAQIEGHQHMMFLSHYKVEAGTEAALMRTEIEGLLQLFGSVEAEQLEVPIFLDSEDLTDLAEIVEHVKRSFNLVLLLTDGVLYRPWVLLELVTAVNSGVPVILVQVARPGVEFQFPSDKFYSDLLAGKTLDDSAKQLLASCGIDLHTIEETLRKIFRTIAVPYSPHRPVSVRNAELQRLIRNCKFRGGESMQLTGMHHDPIDRFKAPDGSLNITGISTSFNPRSMKKKTASVPGVARGSDLSTGL